MSAVADDNECLSNPCNGQGACVDMRNGYLCDCNGGATGKFCERSEYDSIRFCVCVCVCELVNNRLNQLPPLSSRPGNQKSHQQGPNHFLASPKKDFSAHGVGGPLDPVRMCHRPCGPVFLGPIHTGHGMLHSQIGTFFL